MPRVVVRSAGRLVVRNGEKLKLPRFVTMFHLSVMAGATSNEFFVADATEINLTKSFPLDEKTRVG